jgi:hypothetical protein
MKMLVGQVPSHAPRFSVPHHAAITAQQSCSNNDDKTLIGRDGMSKTAMWKKSMESGTSQMRKRSLRGMPVPTPGGALFIHDKTKGDR